MSIRGGGASHYSRVGADREADRRDRSLLLSEDSSALSGDHLDRNASLRYVASRHGRKGDGRHSESLDGNDHEPEVADPQAAETTAKRQLVPCDA